MGLVRIVGGALRGRRVTVPDRGVRPTSERTREAIFDILGAGLVRDARVLDLYAGTGALGIEALSRGAAHADFLEGSASVAASLRENLEELGVASRARVVRADLDRAALPRQVAGPWRLIFLDPPYDGTAGARWVGLLSRPGHLEPEGILVFERRKGAPAPVAAPLAFATERTYGDTTVAFYRAGGPSESC